MGAGMSDVAEAIDEEAVPVTLLRVAQAGAAYDARGNAIAAAAVSPTTILAAMQPAEGRLLRDLPEGVRNDVAFLGWSREEVAVGAVIGYRDHTLKVIQVWPRPEDGFTKFAMSETVA